MEKDYCDSCGKEINLASDGWACCLNCGENLCTECFGDTTQEECTYCTERKFSEDK